MKINVHKKMSVNSRRSKTSRMAEKAIPYVTGAIGAALASEGGPYAMAMGAHEGYKIGKETVIPWTQKIRDLHKPVDFKKSNLKTANEFAMKSYETDFDNKHVEGYNIVADLTTDDRTVWEKNGKAIIAFRGTDPTGFRDEMEGFMPTTKKELIQNALKNGWYSRAFRDTTTDILLALDLQDYSHRFWNAEKVTKKAIERYGKDNVQVVGHSLGGTQAMHVSRKFDVRGVAFNPFVHPATLERETSFNKIHLVHNITDPISIFSPFVKTGETTISYNRTRYPLLGQHYLYGD